jgi:hypothetical protein
MDDIQRPASVPGRHRITFDDPLHAQNEVRIRAIQQSEPFMAVGDQTVQLVLIGVTLARDEMVDQLPTPAAPVPRSASFPATER